MRPARIECACDRYLTSAPTPRRGVRDHPQAVRGQARRFGRPPRQRRRTLPEADRAARAIRDRIWSPTRRRRTIRPTATSRRLVARAVAATAPARSRGSRRLGAASRSQTQVRAMLGFTGTRHPLMSTTATTSARKRRTGVSDAFDFPGFVPAYIRPLFCRGKGPFRWVALSGDPEDISAPTRTMKELFPGRPQLCTVADDGRRADRVSGPAGAHLLDRSRRAPSRRAAVQRHGATAS